MEDPEVVKARVVAALRSIDAGAFDPTPGPHCTYCDFRAFCSEGKAWLAAKDASRGYVVSRSICCSNVR